MSVTLQTTLLDDDHCYPTPLLPLLPIVPLIFSSNIMGEAQQTALRTAAGRMMLPRWPVSHCAVLSLCVCCVVVVPRCIYCCCARCRYAPRRRFHLSHSSFVHQ